MSTPAVVAWAVAGIPAAWFALVLADRIPDARPLWSPAPAIPFPRGRRALDIGVYPVVVGLFALSAARFDEVVPAAAYAGLFMVLVALSVIDLATLRLPDRLVFPATGVSLVVIGASAAVAGEWPQLTGALMGAGLYFGVLLLAHLIHPRGMGFGDVKMAFLMGLYLGWPAGPGLGSFVVVVWAMLIGFGLGSVLGIGILVVRGRSAPYPFGPFLAAGAVAIMLLAPSLLPERVDLLF